MINKNARRRQMLTAGHYIILTDQAEPVFPCKEILLHILQSPRDFLRQRSILLGECKLLQFHWGSRESVPVLKSMALLNPLVRSGNEYVTYLPDLNIQSPVYKFMFTFYHEMRFYTVLCVKISAWMKRRRTKESTKEYLDFLLYNCHCFNFNECAFW